MNTRLYMALRTPMSRTWAARSLNASDSWSWRPNSFTSMAPATLKRSVIIVFISALRSKLSRVIAASWRPTRLAGMRKTGRRSTARSVSCHWR